MAKPSVLSVSLIGLALVVILINSFFRSKSDEFTFEVPKGFPAPVIPPDNQFTNERIALGKQLFYDKILSKNRTVSCASCHKPEFSFADNARFSFGVGDSLTERNTMPLVNLAWVNMFFWDGGVPTLELQVMKPLTNPKEMNLSVEEAVRRLNADKKYVKLFKEAYGAKPDANSLFRAIACFERTLVSANSRFDRFYFGKDAMAYTDSEIRGYYLFMGNQMHCFSCHNGPNLGFNSFQNNGLYENYPDEGRWKVTGVESDKGKFKVPSLRNVALTA
ncbi:MAG: cytochrome-c peroxidase, partial [Cytophagales bacterium]|nr:cytochrome-c peroxidase [Cytophagales bacterium]